MDKVRMSATVCLMLFMVCLTQADIGEWTADAFCWWAPWIMDITLGRFEPAATPVIYAADSIPGYTFFKSEDEAANWIHVTIPEINSPRTTICEYYDPDVVYIGSLDDGVYKSSEGGAHGSWQPKIEGLTNFQPVCFAMHPDAPNTVYLGTLNPRSGETGSLFRTTNGGDLWENTSPTSQWFDVYDIAIDPHNSLRLFTCGRTAPGQPPIFRSTDGGQSWVPAGTGIPGKSIRSLAIDPLQLNLLLFMLEETITHIPGEFIKAQTTVKVGNKFSIFAVPVTESP